MDTIIQILAGSWAGQAHVENVVRLIDEGEHHPLHRPLPQGAPRGHGRYRPLRTLADRLQYLRNLDKRREEVKSAIEGARAADGGLSAAIDAAATLAEVEDLYRPYKAEAPHPRHRGPRKGLGPLAELLFAQAADGPAPEEAAGAFVDPEKGGGDGGGRPPGEPATSSPSASPTTRHPQAPAELVWKGYLVSAAAARSRRTPSTGSTTPSAPP